jgi:poly(A) polymerase
VEPFAFPPPLRPVRSPADAPAAVVGSPVFDALRAIAREDGRPIHVIGGYVRDFFLGLSGTDLDVVTLGSGTELARKFADRVGAREVVCYESFKTALVCVGDFKVEFVGARKESYRADSRKPIVEDGTFDDDRLRRDFTLNAISISLSEHDFGAVHDPLGGREDMRDGKICAPTARLVPSDADRTFSEDPLRILRAVRFAARFGYAVEYRTLQAAVRHLDRLSIVSKERIAEELNKMLLADLAVGGGPEHAARPPAGMFWLDRIGLLDRLLPELAAMKGVESRDGVAHKDNFIHTLKVLENLCKLSDDLWLRWAALLHDVGKPKTKRFEPGVGWTFHNHDDRGARMVAPLFRRLALPQNEKMRFVEKMVRLHQRPIALVDEEVTDSALRRLAVEAGQDLDALLTLCRADVTTAHQGRKNRRIERYRQLEQRIREIEARDNLRNWQPPITGEIVMRTFGVPPGPIVGKIKNAVREAILDGQIENDFDAAFGFMLRVADAAGLQPVVHRERTLIEQHPKDSTS